MTELAAISWPGADAFSVEEIHNVVHWAEMSAGGHFAAMEQPAAFVEYVRAFFRPLRNDR